MLPRKNFSGFGVFLNITTFLLVFLGNLSGLGGGRSEALAGISYWNDGNGNWSEAAKWVPKVVPNGPEDLVTIDRGVTVTVDMNPMVNQLIIGSGNTLNIKTYQCSLQMAGVSPMIMNNGIINVLGYGGWPCYLYSIGTGATVLTGDGVLNLT